MKKIIDLFNLKQLSFSLIVLPYLAFNCVTIVQSPFFSASNLLLLFLGLLSIDIIIRLLLKQIGTRFYTTSSLLTAYIIIIFFYGFYIALLTQNGISYLFNISIRGRVILEFFCLVFILITVLARNKKVNFQYFNIFQIIFFTIVFFSSLVSYKSNKMLVYKSNYIKTPSQNKSNKPVILIISDEYTSPDDLYKVYKDSSIYKFSNNLKNNGWIIKNSFYSYETSTIHSLSSMFNFNLSKDSKYSNEKIENIASLKLIRAKLADSLRSKNVKIINFGIFHFGKIPYLNRLYIYPTSFFDQVFLNTIYYQIRTNTGDLDIRGLTNSYHPIEQHNKFLIKHLADSLHSLNQSIFFSYVHLYMPHAPFQNEAEFSYRSKNSLENYKAYWDFTNNKLEEILSLLKIEGKYKIILAGDHGLRSEDKRINSNYTFTAFYGFEKGEVNKIKSIQDLGSLINWSFE